MISYVELFVIEDLNNRISFLRFCDISIIYWATPIIVVHEYSPDGT